MRNRNRTSIQVAKGAQRLATNFRHDLKFLDSRFAFYKNVGTDLTGVTDTSTALSLANLDYTVEKHPIYLADGTLVNDQYCNIKSNDGTQLGVVGKQYTIVQNEDAFDFLDSILQEGASFVSAGNFTTSNERHNYGKSFVLMQHDSVDILGDEIRPFTLFTNSFDGTGSVQATFLPLRMVCQNGMHRIYGKKNDYSHISIRHSSTALSRLQIAQSLYLSNMEYLKRLRSESELLACNSLTKAQFELEVIPLVLNQMQLDREERKRGLERAEAVRTALMAAYAQSDINNFRGTAYGALLAVSDFESHFAPFRNTNNSQVYFQRVAAGMAIYNAVANALSTRAKYKIS